MAIYYASVGYTSTPETRQTIPVGGNHPLHFPFDEQRDPWKMHPRRHPDGHVVEDFLTDNRSAMILPAVQGLATIQLEIVWFNTGTFTRRHYIVSEEADYENQMHSRLDVNSWASLTPVFLGEPFAVLVGHDSPSPQDIASARLLVTIQDDIAVPPDGRIRVRPGGETEEPPRTETPAEPGGGTPPEIPDWEH